VIAPMMAMARAVRASTKRMRWRDMVRRDQMTKAISARSGQ